MRSSVVGWHDTAFPGWLEVTVSDVGGRVHRIVEKAPVLTGRTVRVSEDLPLEMWLRGEHVRMDRGAVVVRLVRGVVTADGSSELTLDHQDVRWL
ncbi:hypothetical protein [Microlunatus antarcticus]|uniref:Uncharacterized protein n=1 Tax=Microlunatus antarcticus TaxID=53388 RepID=A0A7W5JXC7_9ACTN|nr:hypothetical protein [Microlunatus antarcticus]MBB3328062.1 hypothetical protein [Microlunatus antarcticus]